MNNSEKIGYQSNTARKQIEEVFGLWLYGRSIAATMRFCLKDGLLDEVTMMIAAARWAGNCGEGKTRRAADIDYLPATTT